MLSYNSKMTNHRQSNSNRSEWNRRCRDNLSKHIYENLGILIEPSQVRLRTTSDDVYTWERINDKEHLFSKNISDHSVRSLKELYRDVGISFEAVGNETSHEVQGGDEARIYLHCPKKSGNFHSKINELQALLATQQGELKKWQDQMESEMKLRREAETKVNNLENSLSAALKDNGKLETSVQEWKLVAEEYQVKFMSCDNKLKRIFAYFGEELGMNPSYN